MSLAAQGMTANYKIQSPVEGAVLGSIVLPPKYVDSKEYRAKGIGFTSWSGRPYRLDQHGNPYYKCKTCNTWKPASSRYYYKVGNHCITRFSLRQSCKQCKLEENKAVHKKYAKDINLTVFLILKYKKTSDSWEYRGLYATRRKAIVDLRKMAKKEDAVYQLNGKHTLFKIIPEKIKT